MPKYIYQDAENRSGPIPEGDYVVKVTDASSGLTSTNHEMIKLRLAAQGGGAIYENLVFTEPAYWRIDTFLKSVGIRPPKGTEVEIHPQSLVGKIGRAKVIIEEYNGKQRNRIEMWYTDWDRSSLPPHQPKMQLAPPSPQPAIQADDDVPF